MLPSGIQAYRNGTEGVLSTLGLTVLGVGSTLGVGVYVLAGDVAKNLAGPAVVLSFLLAAVISVFAGLCYTEFAIRVPKATSIYAYSNECRIIQWNLLGQFTIGWNLILLYILGTASVVKILSEYLDYLFNKAMSMYLESVMPIDSPHLARYPDVLAFIVIVVFFVGLAMGVKESRKSNYFFTGVNLLVVLFVIICGSFNADTENWRIPARNDTLSGFAPYGVAGIIKGAAVCIYGFIGFDYVVTADRLSEARRPKKYILAVVASVLVAFLAYFGVSCVLTLVMPYYLQDETAPFLYMFDYFGSGRWQWAKYVVSIGALCSMFLSLLSVAFPLPRILYAMLSDGLLFRFMGRVSEVYQPPVAGTIIAGFFTGILAMIFRVERLIHTMCICTLLTYSMFASFVLLLRYDYVQTANRGQEEVMNSSVPNMLRQLVNADRHQGPTYLSARTVSVLVLLYGVWCFIMMSGVRWFESAGHAGAVAMFTVGTVLVALTLLAISRQPMSDNKLAFSVPLVPWLPGLCILINIGLMLHLDYTAWLMFAIWIAAGLVMFFTYGMKHNSKRRRIYDNKQHNVSQDNQIASPVKARPGYWTTAWLTTPL